MRLKASSRGLSSAITFSLTPDNENFYRADGSIAPFQSGLSARTEALG